MLTHEDRLLDLGLLDVAVLAECHNALAVLCRNHLLILHLLHLFLDLLVVALLQLHDLAGSLARFLNFLARLELLLLEEGDTICEQLSIALHATHRQKQSSQQ